MRVAHSHRFTGGPAPHCPSGKQDHDRLRAQPSVVVQRRRTVARRGPRVKASHHGDRDHRARRRVAARLRRARPALALRAKASRSAVPAPWPQQTGGRVPRANADHARRANSNAAAHARRVRHPADCRKARTADLQGKSANLLATDAKGRRGSRGSRPSAARLASVRRSATRVSVARTRGDPKGAARARP